MSWKDMVAELERRGIGFEEGLSDAEVQGVEERFDFLFPPDLRAFLQTALPVRSPGDSEYPLRKRGFPNWRHGDPEELEVYVQGPFELMLAFVEEYGFWVPEWPERPRDTKAAVALVAEMLAEAPKLIPVYKHRFMPERPREEGNPVFSLEEPHITMCYGADLRSYLHHEFLRGEGEHVRAPREWKAIPFWDFKAFGEWYG